MTPQEQRVHVTRLAQRVVDHAELPAGYEVVVVVSDPDLAWVGVASNSAEAAEILAAALTADGYEEHPREVIEASGESRDTRLFPLGDILTLTTGRMLSPTGMSGLHAIVSYLTGDLATDTACVVMQPRLSAALQAQHPALREVQVPGELDADAVPDWLAQQERRLGRFLPVRRLQTMKTLQT